MQYKKFNDVYVLRLEKGEEVHTELKKFAMENNFKGGYIFGIGALIDIKIGYYSLETQEYVTRDFKNGMEVTGLMGNLSVLNNEPFFHLHVNLGDENFSLYGGHLVSGTVSITLELIFRPFDDELTRAFYEVEKFNLLKLR
ncbi:MAG: DNA-binding protein [Candidatus Coatesbacteria bacterium]|nr:DNA-binding protein [Candidatus Coatesbacteria bacterium]